MAWTLAPTPRLTVSSFSEFVKHCFALDSNGLLRPIVVLGLIADHAWSEARDLQQLFIRLSNLSILVVLSTLLQSTTNHRRYETLARTFNHAWTISRSAPSTSVPSMSTSSALKPSRDRNAAGVKHGTTDGVHASASV